MAKVYAYVAHKDGVLDDTAAELAAAAKLISAEPATAIVTGEGIADVASAAADFFGEVWAIDSADLAYPNAEVVRKAVLNNVEAGSIVLLPNTTFGMDMGPGLSIKLDSAYASDVVEIEGGDGDTLKVVRQEFGGVVSAHVTVDMASGAVIAMRPGAVAPAEGGAGGSVVSKDAGDVSCKRKFVEIREAEGGDVDITKAEVLVSVGRGIEDEDNLEVAFDLAKAIGSHAEVSCSRPIVDAKWMDASRQVGTSGKSVKPNIYLAMGISGSFQHMGGVKGGFVIAVNKNANAPIFQVANVGIEADILEFMPEFQEALEEL